MESTLLLYWTHFIIGSIEILVAKECQKGQKKKKKQERRKEVMWYVIIEQGTLMSPLLILASVPTSNTGVFPYKFLSSSGPRVGRCRPNRVVSPSKTRDTSSRKRSTSLMGNHLSNHMDSPKVDIPSISRGRTWTFKNTRKKKEKVTQKGKTYQTKGTKKENQKAKMSWWDERNGRL